MATDMLMSPVGPGEILLAEFLEPLGVSQYQLAKAMDMPTRGINGIAQARRRISADTGDSVHLVKAVATAAQAGRVEAMSNRNSHRLPAI